MRLACLLLCAAAFFPLAATSLSSSPLSLSPDYAHALMAADRFLQAWQTGDVEGGMVLLSNDVKRRLTNDALEDYFSHSGSSAYEITRGKQMRAGRYDFPVVLVTAVTGNKNMRRRFSSILVVRTSSNDWAVDKLP